MSRTIQEIYSEAVKERNKRLELSEFSNDSKLSILNAITWVVAAMIFTFEALLDVFALEVTNTINNRINGTPLYYVNALLQYQEGDTLTIRDDGLAFGYNSVDESKRIITQVSYIESTDDINLDSKLLLKIAQGEKGNLSAVEAERLIPINAYISQIKFAGTRIEVISRKGDILIPKITVYYNGSVLEAEIYDSIEETLNEYIMDMDFDSSIYVSSILETIKKLPNVTDVHIDNQAIPEQGIFIAFYDADGKLSIPQKIERMTYANSGYLRQSSGNGDESAIPNFRQSITLLIDKA